MDKLTGISSTDQIRTLSLLQNVKTSAANSEKLCLSVLELKLKYVIDFLRILCAIVVKTKTLASHFS